MTSRCPAATPSTGCACAPPATPRSGRDGTGAVAGTDAAGPPDPLGATDRRLLALLVAGVADKAVATRMGLSRRTVQRRIQRLMELAGATTRMQLAWQAARRGWL